MKEEKNIIKDGVSFVPVDPKKRTSKVFEFFYIHEASHLLDKDAAESERSCCTLCKKFLKGINTSNLRTHLQAAHNSMFFPRVQAFLKQNQEEKEEKAEAEEKALKVSIEIALFFLSHILFRFFFSQSLAQSHLGGVVISSGSSRGGHSTRYKSKSNEYKRLTLELLKMICLDKKPLNIVNQLGFRSFCFVMNPAYTVPSHAYFSTVTSFPSVSVFFCCLLSFIFCLILF